MDAHERNPRRRLGRAMSLCAMGLVAAVLYVLSIGPVLAAIGFFGPYPSPGLKIIEVSYSPILVLVDRGVMTEAFCAYVRRFDGPSGFYRTRATRLLANGRRALNAENFDHATDLALKSRGYDAEIWPFDDSPDSLLRSVRECVATVASRKRSGLAAN